MQVQESMTESARERAICLGTELMIHAREGYASTLIAIETTRVSREWCKKKASGACCNREKSK